MPKAETVNGSAPSSTSVTIAGTTQQAAQVDPTNATSWFPRQRSVEDPILQKITPERLCRLPAVAELRTQRMFPRGVQQSLRRRRGRRSAVTLPRFPPLLQVLRRKNGEGALAPRSSKRRISANRCTRGSHKSSSSPPSRPRHKRSRLVRTHCHGSLSNSYNSNLRRTEPCLQARHVLSERYRRPRCLC